MEIERRLSRFPVPEQVQREWEYDMRISARGVAADRELVDGALYCGTAIEEAAKQEAIELTGLENPKSREQMLTWLQGHGVAIPDLRSATVEDALEHKDEYEPDVARVLELRQLLSKASIKKYSTVVTTMCEDGRIRGLLQFYGANRTGRWAGRLVQVQNLPRTYLHGAMLDTARDLTRQEAARGAGTAVRQRARYTLAAGADGTGAEARLQVRGCRLFRYRGACGCVACGRGMGLAGFPHARQDIRGNRKSDVRRAARPHC